MDFLTIGIIGYGRLGSLYARYCKAFGSKVLIYDPYVKVRDKGLTQVESIATIAKESDVISLHVHVNEETTGMINKKIFSKLKNDVLIVNTSRGEIVNEIELVEFLSKNRKALFASDVLADEIKNRTSSPIFKYAKENQNQVTITQHIGGMTKEAQQIAYRHAAKLLKQYFMDK